MNKVAADPPPAQFDPRSHAKEHEGTQLVYRALRVACQAIDVR